MPSRSWVQRFGGRVDAAHPEGRTLVEGRADYADVVRDDGTLRVTTLHLDLALDHVAQRGFLEEVSAAGSFTVGDFNIDSTHDVPAQPAELTDLRRATSTSRWWEGHWMDFVEVCGSAPTRRQTMGGRVTQLTRTDRAYITAATQDVADANLQGTEGRDAADPSWPSDHVPIVVSVRPARRPSGPAPLPMHLVDTDELVRRTWARFDSECGQSLQSSAALVHVKQCMHLAVA